MSKFYMKNNVEVDSDQLCLHGKPGFELKDLTPFLTLLGIALGAILCFHIAQGIGTIGGSLISLIDAEWGSRVFCFGFLGAYWLLQMFRKSPRQAIVLLGVILLIGVGINQMDLVGEFRQFVGIPTSCSDIF